MALKVGIVGYRGIANSHGPNWAKDDLVDLVAICDVVKHRADKAAAEFGAKAYYSVKDMLDNEDLDIVDVCTGGLENGSWHYEPAMEAIARGKNVLVEKPMSNDIIKGREMVRFAAEKKVYLGCDLNHYFTEPADKAMEYIKNDQIGEISYCLHKMGFNGGEFTYSNNPNKKADFPYFHMKAFLTHPFSVMRHFCGDITHIQAFADKPGFRKTKGDVLVSLNSIHVKFASGAVGYLLSQRGDVPYGLGGWWSIEVAGSKGTFCIENCVEKITYWPASKDGEGIGLNHTEPIVTKSSTDDFSSTFTNRLHAFAEDITNKVPLEDLRASGRDALAVLEYTFAVIESYEKGGIMVQPHALPLLVGDPMDFAE